MDFEFSPKVKDLQKRVAAFMEEHIYPERSEVPGTLRRPE